MSTRSDIRVKVSMDVFNNLDSQLKRNYTFSDSSYSMKIISSDKNYIIFGLNDLYSYGNDVKIDFIKNFLKELPDKEPYKLIEIRDDGEDDILTNDYNNDLTHDLYLVKSFSVG